ncbi:hypothetical protein MMC16_002565 [Acarospora aff. strigata]|nr:hypothetical protein [Acarospora aff. strigata]
MNANGVEADQNPITPPRNGYSSGPVPAPEPVLVQDSPTPTIAQPHDQERPVRRTLQVGEHTTSHHTSEIDYPTSLSPPASNLSTPALEVQALQWSAAVGRATTGKSGRVIERLMGENDRLRRELKLQSLRCEEEAKRSEMARSKLESLQASNDNLISMREVDKTALTRRERKIEELKADLEGERSRREKAERETKETSKERDEIVARCRMEVMEEKETSKKATTQYDVLSSSWKGLTDGYRHQMEMLKADIKTLNEKSAEDRKTLEKLKVVMEQTRQESEKMGKVKQAVAKKFEDYKTETEEAIRSMREKAARNEKANEGVLGEVEKVVGEMRHVINLKNDLREEE